MRYTIPEKYKTMCTDNFLKEFRRQLYRMHEHYSLDLFADEGIPINTSTTGWYASFGKACLLTNNEKLLDYYDKLGWEDSDIFDDELTNMMVDKKILLDEIDKYAIKNNIIQNTSDSLYCCKCGQMFVKKDMLILPPEDEEYEWYKSDNYIPYACKKCLKINPTIQSISEKLANKYGSFTNFLSKELNLDEKDVCRCSKCGGYYTKDMGILEDNFICDYCNDQSGNDEFASTNYFTKTYKEVKERKNK